MSVDEVTGKADEVNHGHSAVTKKGESCHLPDGHSGRNFKGNQPVVAEHNLELLMSSI